EWGAIAEATEVVGHSYFEGPYGLVGAESSPCPSVSVVFEKASSDSLEVEIARNKQVDAELLVLLEAWRVEFVSSELDSLRFLWVHECGGGREECRGSWLSLADAISKACRGDVKSRFVVRAPVTSAGNDGGGAHE